jgi:hypothetical protein
MPTCTKLAALAISLPLLALMGVADAQQAAGDTDTDYTARAMTAAPPEVAHDAAIVRVMNGAEQTLRKGANEYTCMVGNEGPMCMGPIATQWVQAWQNHTLPPNQLGFIYMLGGDTGVSTIDPWATRPVPGNHWVKTGPHVMMVGLAVKRMTFPRTPDPDPRKPYVVWSGTLYEHVVLPMNRNSP